MQGSRVRPPCFVTEAIEPHQPLGRGNLAEDKSAHTARPSGRFHEVVQHSAHCASRPRAMRPARSHAFKCFETAGMDISKGLASSVTDVSPIARARMARRVGSASAAKAALHHCQALSKNLRQADGGEVCGILQSSIRVDADQIRVSSAYCCAHSSIDE